MSQCAGALFPPPLPKMLSTVVLILFKYIVYSVIRFVYISKIKLKKKDYELSFIENDFNLVYNYL
jgi:hypothetical protein